jgi:hypothetical protein
MSSSRASVWVRSRFVERNCCSCLFARWSMATATQRCLLAAAESAPEPLKTSMSTRASAEPLTLLGSTNVDAEATSCRGSCATLSEGELSHAAGAEDSSTSAAAACCTGGRHTHHGSPARRSCAAASFVADAVALARVAANVSRGNSGPRRGNPSALGSGRLPAASVLGTGPSSPVAAGSAHTGAGCSDAAVPAAGSSGTARGCVPSQFVQSM